MCNTGKICKIHDFSPFAQVGKQKLTTFFYHLYCNEGSGSQIPDFQFTDPYQDP